MCVSFTSTCREYCVSETVKSSSDCSFAEESTDCSYVFGQCWRVGYEIDSASSEQSVSYTYISKWPAVAVLFRTIVGHKYGFQFGVLSMISV